MSKDLFQPLPFCNSLMSLLIFMDKTHLFRQLQIELLGNYWPIACTIGTEPAQIVSLFPWAQHEPCCGAAESCRWCLELSGSPAIQGYKLDIDIQYICGQQCLATFLCTSGHFHMSTDPLHRRTWSWFWLQVKGFWFLFCFSVKACLYQFLVLPEFR